MYNPHPNLQLTTIKNLALLCKISSIKNDIATTRERLIMVLLLQMSPDLELLKKLRILSASAQCIIKMSSSISLSSRVINKKLFINLLLLYYFAALLLLIYKKNIVLHVYYITLYYYQYDYIQLSRHKLYDVRVNTKKNQKKSSSVKFSSK